MKKYVNGEYIDMTPEEITALNEIPVEQTVYDEQTAMVTAVRLLMQDKRPETADERILCAALYPVWAAGVHAQGDIYTVDGDPWECIQNYDNGVYPDISPGNAAWHTFNRPYHGTTLETARNFVQPTGAHDMYKAGEWMIYGGKAYKCLSDTAYGPGDYYAAWEAAIQWT